jgi:hypothetical protein
MSLTSQNLSDAEKELYKKIEKKFPSEVNQIRKQIIETQIKPTSQVSKDIAAAIRTRILTNPALKNV